MKNKSLHQIIRAAVLLAAGMAGACSEETAVPVSEGEFYDGPLQIRANIEGTLETRTTYPEGQLKGDTGTWYLSAPLREYTALSTNVLGVLQATFNDEGYADLKDPAGNPVTLTWNDLAAGPTDNGDNYGFVLDNVLRMKGYRDNSFVDGFVRIQGNGGSADYFAVLFKDAEQTKYGAALEKEEGINENDILQGYLSFKSGEVGNKVFLDFSLKHVMARVHVELSSSLEGLDLSQKDVKVWIDRIAAKSYGMNRGRWTGARAENNTILIYPLDQTVGTMYDYTYTKNDAAIYADTDEHTFYLLGSKAAGEKMKVADGKYCTRNLILPPQSTRNSPDEDATLRPKIYVEVDGKTYWSYLPSVITPSGSGMENFSEFKSGWDITLKGDIGGDQPYIQFTAIVKDWVGVGSYVLDSRESGIYSEADYYAAVDAFDAFYNFLGENHIDTNKPDTEEADPTVNKNKKKLKHALERYGHFNSSGPFVFWFFTDIQESDKVPENKKYFIVNAHGHKVFGETDNVKIYEKINKKRTGSS